MNVCAKIGKYSRIFHSKKYQIIEFSCQKSRLWRKVGLLNQSNFWSISRRKFEIRNSGIFYLYKFLIFIVKKSNSQLWKLFIKSIFLAKGGSFRTVRKGLVKYLFSWKHYSWWYHHEELFKFFSWRWMIDRFDQLDALENWRRKSLFWPAKFLRL